MTSRIAEASGNDRSSLETLGGALIEKGFSPEVAAIAMHTLPDGLGYVYAKATGSDREGDFPDLSNLQRVVPSYEGTPQENSDLDQLTARNERTGLAELHKKGALRAISREIDDYVRISDLSKHADGIETTPVAVIGQGAAGIIATAMLLDSGFRKITVFEKKKEPLGIWGQRNVAGGTKNNPFPLSYKNVASTDGVNDLLEGSGEGIGRLLDSIVDRQSQFDDEKTGNPSVRKVNGVVTAVKPGDLDHTIVFKEGTSKRLMYGTFPIVVNCMGTGQPRVPNADRGISSRRFSTDLRNGELGQRWQQQLSGKKLEELNGKKVVLIGLGNSTFEMIFQFEEAKKSGIFIDYMVVTDHELIELQNAKAVKNNNGRSTSPSSIFEESDFSFRDIRVPNLTSLAGDLRFIGRKFDELLDSERIIAGVKHITKAPDADGRLVLEKSNGLSVSVDFDSLYTLIGYQHSGEKLRDFGFTVLNHANGTVAVDFDGEVQRPSFSYLGRDRIYPGYFALGPVIRNPLNPNAETIPGIFYRVQPLVLHAMLRALEFKTRNKK